MFSNQVMRTSRVECSRSHVVIVEPEGEFVGLCPEVDVFWLSGGLQQVRALLRTCGGHASIIRQQADAALAPTRENPLLAQIVQVDGLVGAVEPAHAQVDDRTCDMPPIVRRHGDAIGRCEFSARLFNRLWRRCSEEVALTMNKRRYWLWRAVDQDGTVLDILVQSRRDQHTAERFLRRVLELEHAVAEAQAYFDLACAYASRAEPMLLVTMDLPASGKTTLAHALAGRLGLVHVSSDAVRKQLAGMRPTEHCLDGFERGLYGRSMSRRTYAMLRKQAARWLRRGQSLVLDATYSQPAERAALRQLARRTGVRLVVIVCRADESVLQGRLAARLQDPHSVSDARPDLWPALKAAFVEPAELSETLSVDTTQPLDLTISEILRALDASTQPITPGR